MGQENLQTGMASEFYVLSMLFRKGANAQLTLGNNKFVDIVVQKGSKTLTIDVKGLKGKTNFPIDNLSNYDPNHYVIFVCYNNKIEDHNTIPDCYILKAKHLKSNSKKLVYQNPKRTRRVVTLTALKENARLLSAWTDFIDK